MWYSFRPYVSAAQRRTQAREYTRKLEKGGRKATPVSIGGRTIAKSFWGKAWCDHLEAYSDFANRLPRGRTYVRNGSVIDLQIAPGKVSALVSGSDIYKVAIGFEPLAKNRWTEIKRQCAGQIASMVELLQGRFSDAVMGIITHREQGLFPSPREIKLDCSCPDGAYMCKHVAAVLYGVGSRLDHQPELFFTLRQVDHSELLAAAATHIAAIPSQPSQQTIATDDLSNVFGVDIDSGLAEPLPPPAATTPALKTTPAKARKAKAAIKPKAKAPLSRKPAKPKPKPRKRKTS